jgi:hypothetical protein
MHTTDSVVSTRQVDRPTHPGQRRGNMVRFAVTALFDHRRRRCGHMSQWEQQRRDTGFRTGERGHART